MKMLSLAVAGLVSATAMAASAQSAGPPAQGSPPTQNPGSLGPNSGSHPSGSAAAPESEPAPPTVVVSSGPAIVAPAATPEAEWMAQFRQTREMMARGDFAGSAAQLGLLIRTAPSPFYRALALELSWLANRWIEQRMVLVGERDERALPPVPAAAKNLRTTDELGLLYGAAILYGVGTGGAVAVFSDPKTPAGAILPALGIAGVSVGAVAVLDAGRGMAYGVPQSISTGLYIGLEEGITLAFWNQARVRSIDEWSSKTVASVIWGVSTAGAIAGGVIGTTQGTTPGRAAFVGSAALWSGLFTGLMTAGLVKDDDETDDKSLLAAALGLNAGAVLGVVFAGDVSPSISRVRFVDLGGLGGGLVFGGIYLAAAGKNPDPQRSLVAASLGIASGLGITWAATRGMAPDRPSFAPEKTALVQDLQVHLLPSKNGLSLGLSGALF